MAPNLFLLAQKASKPQTWFRKPSPPAIFNQTETWSYPARGKYKHTVNGWYLIAPHNPETNEYEPLARNDWERVVYFEPSRNYELQSFLEERSEWGVFASKPDMKPIKFCCLPEDNATYILCWREDGTDTRSGPYQRFVKDHSLGGKFRPMTKGDDYNIRRRSAGSLPSNTSRISFHSASPMSSLHCSRAGTPVHSRHGSVEMLHAQPHEKRQSLAVPTEAESRPSSVRSRSRSVTPSPMATPSEEREEPRLDALMEQESRASAASEGGKRPL